MIGKCPKCGLSCKVRPSGERVCRPCKRKQHKAWRDRKKDLIKQGLDWRFKPKPKEKAMEEKRHRNREYWRELRHDAIMAYGGYKCRCCGETEPKFLNIDHMFNDGKKHREMVGQLSVTKWLKDNGYPAGFQILCFNCNLGRSLNKGICPHKASSHANRVNSGEVQNGLSRTKLKGIRPQDSPF